MTCSIQISCWLYNIPEKVSAVLSQVLRTKAQLRLWLLGLSHPKATPPLLVTQQTPGSHEFLLLGSVFLEEGVVCGELMLVLLHPSFTLMVVMGAWPSVPKGLGTTFGRISAHPFIPLQVSRATAAPLLCRF